MLRTGQQYKDGLKDGREVWMDGERVKDITTHAHFKPIVDKKARMYDMQFDKKYDANLFSYQDGDQRNPTLLKRPTEQKDWWDKWNALDAYFKDIGGVITRVGDETIGEMWSLFDGRDVLNRIDPRFADNIDRHIQRVLVDDVFHVSANTDPKGDRSRRPQDQDPDMMCHVVKETDKGIIIRGAPVKTASAYADQAFLKPTVGAWTDEKLSDYALGCIVKMGAPGVKHICRTGFSGARLEGGLPALQRLRRGRHAARARQRADPVGGRVLLPLHRGRALHPQHAAPVLGVPVRAAHPLRRRHDDRRGDVELQADRPRQDAVGAREARRPRLLPRGHPRAPRGLDRARREEPRRPADAGNQSLLYAGRIHACSNLPQIMHIARELCGGQLCVTPNYSTFVSGDTKNWMDKFYSLNDNWFAEDRRKLLAFARDLLNSDYAGHRLTFVQFAQAPHFNHLNALYQSFDFQGPLGLVKNFAGLSDKVDAPAPKAGA